MATDVLVSLGALGTGLLRDASRIPEWSSPAGARPPDYLLHPSPGVIVGAHVLGALILLFRRHRPYTVALALMALSLVVPQIGALLALYAIGRYDGRLRFVVATAAGVVTAILAGGNLLWLVGRADWNLGDPYSVLPVAIALSTLGLYVRAREGLVSALVDRAERAEREAVAVAEAVRLRERARLAVSLHDDISRDLTVLTMGAGALVGTGGAGLSREAEHLRKTGQHALEALHRLIRTLSGGGEPMAPAGGEGLAARPTACRAVLLDALAEALVNADKHAPGAPVEVRLDDPVGLAGDVCGARLTVINGPSPSPGRRSVGSGLGLTGLRRRCEQLGGSLRAGPTSEGGWRTELFVPRCSSDTHPVA